MPYLSPLEQEIVQVRGRIARLEAELAQARERLAALTAQEQPEQAPSSQLQARLMWSALALLALKMEPE